MRRSFVTARRAVFVSLAVAAIAIAGAPSASAVRLTPFIDLQEQGLTAVQDGVGLKQLGSGVATLDVDVGGAVRFAVLWWAGRDRPAPSSGGDCTLISPPYKDEQMVFNGNPVTGSIIGFECQIPTPKGPINNIGYFADVTSIVSAAGPGPHSFTLADGNTGSNLFVLDGATLIVAYTDPADPTVYRLMVQDGLDFARANAATGNENRGTMPATFNHGSATSARSAELFIAVGNGLARKGDNITVSNNGVLADELDRDDGPAWDADQFPVTIPAGVDSTTIQVNSGPTHPDVLLWQMVALRLPVPP